MRDVGQRTSWILAGALALFAGLAAAALFWFDPARYRFYPLCLFHHTTGLLCPGCGSLRALHQLLHGNLAAAFRFNPLLVLSLPVLAVIAFRTLRDQPFRFQPKWLWLYLAASLAFGIMRNLPIGPFAQVRM